MEESSTPIQGVWIRLMDTGKPTPKIALCKVDSCTDGGGYVGLLAQPPEFSTSFGPPILVAFRKGNPRKFQGNLCW